MRERQGGRRKESQTQEGGTGKQKTDRQTDRQTDTKEKDAQREKRETFNKQTGRGGENEIREQEI